MRAPRRWAALALVGAYHKKESLRRGLGFRVEGLGFRVQGLGFIGFRV